MNDIRDKYQKLFESEYQRLNEQQRRAVDELYGPVLVVAGPGTGKTQLLAIRVCNILQNKDLGMSASNVLCLTFTDAGAIAMKNRLLRFMGPEAHNVMVSTYHSFCNMVIRENAPYFYDLRELTNASKLEIAEIVVDIIDTMPVDHPLKRNTGDRYYDRPRLTNLFEDMKKEGWTKEIILDGIEQYKQELLADPLSYYRRKTGPHAIGDLMESSFNEKVKKVSQAADAADFFEAYNDGLRKINRIDYQDSILWVIKAFEENEDLLLQYQERFQFVLADEYQDTNGSQNKLLFLLNNYDPKPNLFVVGDDDQAIYRFQGAEVNNITDFIEKFDPFQVVLTDNYRSTQPILDIAKTLIDNNKERLVTKYPKMVKNLVAKATRPITSPKVYRYATTTAQEIGLIHQIMQLKTEGNAYKDIAVIYRKHKEVDNIIKYLDAINIPINISKSQNILEQIDVKRLLKILDYIWGEDMVPMSKNELLFEILHYDFFGIEAKDIAKISVFIANETWGLKDENATDFTAYKWRMVISNEEALRRAGIADPSAILSAASTIEELISKYHNVTFQVLFEMLLTNTHCLAHILADSDAVWRLQAINTLFDQIKNESAKNENFSIPIFLAMIEKMKGFNIDIAISKVENSADGVHFMTAHSSKGLEFKHVFILNCVKETWLGGGSSNFKFKMPPILNNSDGSDEDERRLFYVSITRAIESVNFMVPLAKEGDKEFTPLVFLSEMDFELEKVPQLVIEDKQISDYLATLMQYKQGKVQLINDSLVDRAIDNLVINSTGVSKYMNCKLKFYFENILRVPMARTANIGFGNAIHQALESYITQLINEGKQDFELLLFYFKKGLEHYSSHFTENEKQSFLYEGNIVLKKYFDRYSSNWTTPLETKLEYKAQAIVDDVPISGIIDRLEVFSNHIEVFDYKTGKYSSEKVRKPSDKSEGGDYWRQVVFYKILLENDSQRRWPKFNQGHLDFLIEKEEKNSKKVFSPSDDEVALVKNQIKEVYQGIKNKIFEPGCGDKECRWCNFVKENMNIKGPLLDEEEENDNE